MFFKILDVGCWILDGTDIFKYEMNNTNLMKNHKGKLQIEFQFVFCACLIICSHLLPFTFYPRICKHNDKNNHSSNVKRRRHDLAAFENKKRKQYSVNSFKI